MGKIGILAFGSIIKNPDKEIESSLERIIDGVETDFAVEFARQSSTRDNAPTLAVVSNGGSKVKGKLFILNENVSLDEARSILLRRETDKVGAKNVQYLKPLSWMEIREQKANYGCEKIIYASIAPNLDDPTPRHLAKLAIESTIKNPFKNGARADGIQYLFDIKQFGIRTPLMNDYEGEILKQLGVESLIEALKRTSQN